MATGDVVNTAARLQSAAPSTASSSRRRPRGDEGRRSTTERRSRSRRRGRRGPVQVWEAISAAPLRERAHTTPLVGRESELAQLREALDHVRAKRSPQLVTIVGPPGIGKSRLVYELAQADRELTWRKGRCLPYGDGVPFWALGEIVKAHARHPGERSDRRRPRRSCSPRVDDAWIAGHLRHSRSGWARSAARRFGDRRAEAFAAWRRFLTTLAEEQPLALGPRGHPLGGRRAPRLCDSARRVGAGVAAARALHRPAGAARAPAGLGGDDRPAQPALRRGDRSSPLGSRGGRASARNSWPKRPAIRSTPSSTRGCSPRAARWSSSPDDSAGHHRRPARRRCRRTRRRCCRTLP